MRLRSFSRSLTLKVFINFRNSYKYSTVIKSHIFRKVLLVGSGGLSIGQAGEFDYSGSQAIKALKEEGVKVVLINPNIATVQTGKNLADEIYFLPIRAEYIQYVIEKERPDGVLLTFGGQSALNCGIELFDKGIFKKFNVEILGTPIKTLKTTEDRYLFAKALKDINIPVASSIAVHSVDDAITAANSVGYPVIVRAAFALGGLGSGFASNINELKDLAVKSLNLSSQILVEKSMKGWKEIEYEVVRDSSNNCITVCNMENFDPLGTHTGDSIVIAPSQTLSDQEYHMLRSAAIKIVSHLGVVGECNVQYALNPKSLEFAVIEVNARLSRSSALASKATGYPLAFVAAKLSLGATLPELKNTVTKITTSNFEPSLDYIVTKIPRWDLDKFQHVARDIGPSMKSVGEVMAIGRTWEESLQKAIRMIDPKYVGFQPLEFQNIKSALEHPSDLRLFAIAYALFNKLYTVDEIHEFTMIDKWFLNRLENIVHISEDLKRTALTINSVFDLPKALILKAKKAGFSDQQISISSSRWNELDIRQIRKSYGIIPFVKQIDTLAGEFPSETNYLYTTYNGTSHDVEFDDHGIIVLGSGVYRIGSSVEFDWCGVSTIRSLRKLKYKTIMINYNPETVSTDFDECDRLYFEELSMERVLDIYEIESSKGCIVSVGGQLPQNIALELQKNHVNILGTNPYDLDRAENRKKFSSILDEIGLDQPAWAELTTINEAFEFAEKVKYPVLVRPSYVLSGASMNVAYTELDLKNYLDLAVNVSADHPIVLTKFIEGAEEIDIDAVASQGSLLVYAVSQHVENAGVHSGDATLIFPPVLESEQAFDSNCPGFKGLTSEIIATTKEIAEKVSNALKITGPFNMQLILIRNGAKFSLKIIECNLRASRSFPFVSKVLDVDFIDIAVHAIVGSHLLDSVISNYNFLNACNNGIKAVKSPVFSWTRLTGADPVLGVEMASTGEVACFGKNVFEAYFTSVFSNHNNFKELPMATNSSILLSADKLSDPNEISYVTRKLLKLGYNIFTDDIYTQTLLIKEGIDNIKCISDTLEDLLDNTKLLNDLFKTLKIEVMFSFCKVRPKSLKSLKYRIRSAAVSMGVGYLNDSKNCVLFVDALEHYITGSLKKRDAVKSMNEWQ